MGIYVCKVLALDHRLVSALSPSSSALCPFLSGAGGLASSWRSGPKRAGLPSSSSPSSPSSKEGGKAGWLLRPP